MAKKIVGIYYIQNNTNGKRYIGSSADITRRLNTHLSYLRNGKHVNVHLSRAWNINGESAFETGICEIVTDVSTLIEREQAWIDSDGYYNIAPAAGSTRGFKQSAEFKAAQSARLMGEGNPMFGKKRPEIGEILRKANRGKTLTDEHKRKCSEALRGKGVGIPLSEERKAKIGDANRGKKRTEEQKAKLSATRKTRPPISEETREKLRISSSGFKHSVETRERLSQIKLGIPRSIESILKQKETVRKKKELKAEV